MASVQAVKNTPDAAAGSISNSLRVIGTNDPKNPAATKLINTEAAKTKLKLVWANKI